MSCTFSFGRIITPPTVSTLTLSTRDPRPTRRTAGHYNPTGLTLATCFDGIHVPWYHALRPATCQGRLCPIWDREATHEAFATCRTFPSFRMRIRATIRPCPCYSCLRPSRDRLASRLSHSDCIICTTTTISRQLDVKNLETSNFCLLLQHTTSHYLWIFFLVCSVNSISFFFFFSFSLSFSSFFIYLYCLGYER